MVVNARIKTLEGKIRSVDFSREVIEVSRLKIGTDKVDFLNDLFGGFRRHISKVVQTELCAVNAFCCAFFDISAFVQHAIHSRSAYSRFFRDINQCNLHFEVSYSM